MLVALTIIFLTIIYVGTLLLFMAGMTVRRRGMHTQRHRISIIIAARNEEKNIGNILTDLANQSYDKGWYEVIIANDHSSDKTVDVIEQHSARHANFKLVNMQMFPPRFTPKKWALQKAVEMASGDIILATDADCRVGSRWIETMASYFSPAVGFVIGFSQFGARGASQNLIERFQAFDFLTLMGAAAGSTNLGLPLAASGQNLGYRKTAFQQIGGYQKVAHRVSGDDVLLLQLIRKYSKMKIIFAADPAAFAVSEPQPTLKALINQRKRWASNGIVQLKLNIIFFLYLLQVLLFNAMLLVALVAALCTGQHLDLVLGCVTVRVVSEFAFALKSALYFKRTDLLKYFPLWFIIQIPYIVGIGLAGTFGKFQWKEREHSAQVKSPAAP
ncbi:glycosyltransferase [candidate division KSB1 bacterium]|nr:glycosyltransferase [candidate division KSB1 bacterium]RQW05687.1 MAG: glycosyltransferase [candidate division KSB1 bacterium]